MLSFDIGRHCWLKKSLTILSFSKLQFFHFCKDIANFLFWVLWACLAMTSKSDGISLQKTLMFIYIQKIKFIPHPFLKVWLMFYNLIIMITLTMPYQAQQNHYYQLIASLMLSTCETSTGSFSSSVPSLFCNLIGYKHFSHNLRTKILSEKLFAVKQK